MRITQPQIIDRIINDVHLPKNTTPRQTSAFSNKILWRDDAALPFDERFNYKAGVGNLDYLDKSTRQDIYYATHQCA